jgi:hypothetical protein
MDWLGERYPELLAESEPRRSMAEFDVLLCIQCGFADRQAVAFFELADGASADFALRLRRDARLRERIAAVFGVTLDDFDAAAPTHLRKAHSFPGGFADHGAAARILEPGNA